MTITAYDRPTALITGASRGIGRAIAEELASTHRLILQGRDQQRLQAVAPNATDTEIWPGDITDPSVVDRLPVPAKLDVLVHAAGAYAGSTIAETTPEEWQHVFDVNVFAPMELTRRCLPALRNSGGLVLFVNSAAGFVANPGWGLYAASKFALRAAADSLRIEERPAGVRVASVHPGRTDTDMQHEVVASKGEVYDSQRFLDVQNVADTVRAVVDMPATAVVESVSLRTMHG